MTEILEYLLPTVMEKITQKVSFHSSGSVQGFTVFKHS